MNKRILVTSTDLMMIQFLCPHIINLSKNGYSVDIACSDVGGRIGEVRKALDKFVGSINVVDLSRNPAKIKNIVGYKQMKNIISNGKYDIIWTNEPVMGVVTRLAAKIARKEGTKVLYMVHGFHFFKGAPIINWMIYYPIEKYMASYADIICTVNKEDYNRAKKFKVNQVKYIHGIGINTDRLTPDNQDSDIRSELGLPKDSIVILSIGELNKNKNHETIIKSLLKIQDVHYLICGKGSQLERLESLTKEMKLEDRVHFLGYRMDVVNIFSKSDVFVMPSFREGLPVASLEAMYCGLPLVTSNIRGLVDVMEDGVTGYMYNPDDIDGFAEGIIKLKNNKNLRSEISKENKKRVELYCIDNTKNEVLNMINNL